MQIRMFSDWKKKPKPENILRKSFSIRGRLRGSYTEAALAARQRLSWLTDTPLSPCSWQVVKKQLQLCDPCSRHQRAGGDFKNQRTKMSTAEMVSSRWVREATPTKSQQYGCPHKTWKLATPIHMPAWTRALSQGPPLWEEQQAMSGCWEKEKQCFRDEPLHRISDSKYAALNLHIYKWCWVGSVGCTYKFMYVRMHSNHN